MLAAAFATGTRAEGPHPIPTLTALPVTLTPTPFAVGDPSVSTPLIGIIPNSELVNSPAARDFDAAKFIASQPGRIAHYGETVAERHLTSLEALTFTATNTSVNPRLLLALLEYESKWLSQLHPGDSATQYPMGYIDPPQ